jgi:hypothetical protein
MHNTYSEKIIHKEGVVEYKNFFTKEECFKLIEYFNFAEDGWEKQCFFGMHTMYPLHPIISNQNLNKEITSEYVENIRNRFKVLAEDASKNKLKNLSLSAHKWIKGAYAGAHSDNSDLEGTPNAWKDNKFVTILYLNDNYEGGNLNFDQHDISISPEAGTLIAFDPGFKNLHSVSEIKEGVRYTLMSSWDYEGVVYTEEENELIKKEKEIEAKKKIKQLEEWEKENKYV